MTYPPMPDSAASSLQKGIVKLKGLVDSSGRMVKALVTKSDNRIFNKSALRAFMQWKFKPAMVRGKATFFWTATSFNFRWDTK